MIEKRNVLVIFLIIIIGLIGYIVYDKHFNESGVDNNKNESKYLNPADNDDTIETNEEDINLDYIVAHFPKSNDLEVTGDDIYKEFDFTTSERHDKKFTFNYKNYKIVYDYIDGAGDSSTIKIYYNNKEVYSNFYIKTYISTVDDISNNVLPTISNGLLHLIVYNPDKCYLNNNEDKVAYLEYLQINLNSDEIEINTIKSIKFELANNYTPEGSAPECREK